MKSTSQSPRVSVPLRSVLGGVALSLLAVACGDLNVDPVKTGEEQTGVGSALAQDAPLDVLFVVDDSSSMDDKQGYLGEAATKLLLRFANPNCFDSAGNYLGQSTQGACSEGGTPEFPPVKDIHVGIVSTSLGVGGQEADASGIGCSNDHAHLLARHASGSSFATVDSATNVFSWTAASGRDLGGLVNDVQTAIDAMDEQGCGIESQLESWYRFLVQPDPIAKIAVGGTPTASVERTGVDTTLLAQRKAFLRPGSNVAIVLLSDENDSSVDPLSVSGTGLTAMGDSFEMPRATSACASEPTSDACTSCAFADADPSDPACDGTLTPTNVGTRTFHDKQRFGVELLYPISRYVSGLTNPKVPDRDGEHPIDPITAGPSANYVGSADCDNPLFAGALPADDSGDLCHLGRGPRQASQVFYVAIAGVPHQLLQADANDPASPVKSQLTDADYRLLVGNDPLAYDFNGVDPHMLESLTPRAGIASGDPIVLGDFDTKDAELERACTFPLPAPIDDSQAAKGGPCSVGDPNWPTTDPVCSPTTPTTQLYAGATPAVREIALARALGYQGVVSSICPIHRNDTATTRAASFTNPNADPLFGYEPAATGLVDRMAGK